MTSRDVSGAGSTAGAGTFTRVGVPAICVRPSVDGGEVFVLCPDHPEPEMWRLEET